MFEIPMYSNFNVTARKYLFYENFMANNFTISIICTKRLFLGKLIISCEHLSNDIKKTKSKDFLIECIHCKNSRHEFL